MKRGEIRWYTFRLPDKRRPVLVLTRDEVIDRLHPKSYRWKATKTKGIGFIAQEYLPVIPWGGTARIGEPGDDNFQPAQVDYSSPTPFLVAEVQFLRKRVASLEAVVQGIHKRQKFTSRMGR